MLINTFIMAFNLVISRPVDERENQMFGRQLRKIEATSAQLKRNKNNTGLMDVHAEEMEK